MLCRYGSVDKNGAGAHISRGNCGGGCHCGGCIVGGGRTNEWCRGCCSQEWATQVGSNLSGVEEVEEMMSVVFDHFEHPDLQILFGRNTRGKKIKKTRVVWSDRGDAPGTR